MDLSDWKTMSNRLEMVIKIQVTIPQALALQAMFEYWNQLAGWGGSRTVGFFVDGDGDFKPKCEISFSGDVPKMNKEIAEMAISEDDNGNRNFDYDTIAWFLREGKDARNTKLSNL